MLLDVALPVSLAIIMLSLGIGLTFGDFLRVLKLPKAVAIGLVMQVIALPILAFLLLQIFSLPPGLAFGVMILSFCPGGVTSNMLTRIAGGTVALSITLTAVVSLLSVITIPLLVAWAASTFLGDATQIDVTRIAISMFVITALPVLIGLIIRALLPGFAARIEPGLYILAIVLFVVIILAALALNWQSFIDNIATLGPLLVVLNIIALAIGLGVSKTTGLTGGDAKSIAIELGVQNGTLGITVASLLIAGEGLTEYALPSAIYGITMYLVTVPVVMWLRSRPALP